MCLIAFNWENHPEYKMILVANRDEFYSRPSEPLHMWDSGIYAGKDLKAGGTWMGMSPSGRFAAITNFRDLSNRKKNAETRGNLVKDYLEGDLGPKDYLLHVMGEKDKYDGFNLIVGDPKGLFYFSNFGESIQQIKPGLYGISNAFLATPWEKVRLAKSNLKKHINKNLLHPKELIKVVNSKSTAPDHLLPKTGVPSELEKKLSAQFINIVNDYGTMNTTVLLWKHSNEVEIVERTFLHDGIKVFDKRVNFIVNGNWKKPYLKREK